jgi:hypothetical protein
MKWERDNQSLITSCPSIKLYKSKGNTWGQKIYRDLNKKAPIFIATYSLASRKYLEEIFTRRSKNVYLICHETFISEAVGLYLKFPKLTIATHPEMHVKLVMTGKDTVYLGSANFGYSGWHDTVVGMKDDEIYQFYYHAVWLPMWEESNLVKGKLKDYRKLKTGGKW